MPDRETAYQGIIDFLKTFYQIPYVEEEKIPDFLEEGLNIEDLKRFCKANDITIIALDKDEECLVYEKGKNRNRDALIFRIANNHIYPIFNKKKKDSIVSKNQKGEKHISNSVEGEKKKEPTEKQKLEEEKNKLLEVAEKQLGKLIGALAGGLEKTVQKYEHEVRGIVAALSGAPSTPWHVTIGNPLRPVFCSGDMYTDNVSLKLGSTLAFNDLPSNITLDFTLQNARPWGMQEIIAKFNTGHLRVVNTQKDFTSLNPDEVLNHNKYDYINSSSGTSGTSGSGTTGTSGGGSLNGNVDNKVDPNSGSTTTPTQEGQDNKNMNSDANSTQAPVQNETKKEVESEFLEVFSAALDLRRQIDLFQGSLQTKYTDWIAFARLIDSYHNIGILKTNALKKLSTFLL
jgi:hypothetical protein